MARKDFDEIKKKFTKFIHSWKTKDVSCFDEIIDPEIKCYMSTAKAYADGSQHSMYGIRNFICDMPRTEFFHTRICNYVCRVKDTEAHQAAHAVCIAGLYGEREEGLKYFSFDAMFSNHWVKKESGWYLSELRMDLLDNGGSYEAFREHWFFERPEIKTFPGLHLPCINGELDSPWFRIPDAEDVLCDEEKMVEAVSRYAFGIDNLVFCEVEQAVTDDVIADIQPWGTMDKRTWIAALKYHRQRDRHWGHPCKLKCISRDGENAEMILYRMCGHKQREHPYLYTRENVDIEHACAMYQVKLKKQGNDWKIKRCDYFLGLVELGKYEDEEEKE